VFRGGSSCYGYTLIKRNGIIEATKVRATWDHGLSPHETEARIARPAFRYCQALLALGVSPPLYVYPSLLGVGSNRLTLPGRALDEGEVITRPDLNLPLAVVEDASSQASVAAALRPSFDAMWNAGGYAESPSFTPGTWAVQTLGGE
jgi:hypothetical protein